MGEKLSNENIAEMAANIEVDILGRYMGKQDHYAAAMGGLNKITFKSTEETIIEPLKISDEGIKNLSDNLLLFFSSIKFYHLKITLKLYPEKCMNTSHPVWKIGVKSWKLRFIA